MNNPFNGMLQNWQQHPFQQVLGTLAGMAIPGGGQLAQLGFNNLNNSNFNTQGNPNVYQSNQNVQNIGQQAQNNAFAQPVNLGGLDTPGNAGGQGMGAGMGMGGGLMGMLGSPSPNGMGAGYGPQGMANFSPSPGMMQQGFQQQGVSNSNGFDGNFPDFSSYSTPDTSQEGAGMGGSLNKLLGIFGASAE